MNCKYKGWNLRICYKDNWWGCVMWSAYKGKITLEGSHKDFEYNTPLEDAMIEAKRVIDCYEAGKKAIG